MDLDKLYEILHDTTIQLRKGKPVQGTPELVGAIERGDETLPGGVVTFDMMPPVEEAKNSLVLVDMELMVVGVDKARAEAKRAEFVQIMGTYPNMETLAAGPSYITVGAVVGDQGIAFQLFALGKVLGLWSVITPASLGITGPEAAQMAGSGFIMMSGYRVA